jgi:hypothetical protein
VLHLDLTQPDRLLFWLKSDSDYQQVKSISTEEYLRFEDACGIVNGFRLWARTADYVSANYRELHTYLSHASGDPTAAASADKELVALFFEANRKLLNFLSAARTFLDHTEAHLKRLYGDGSEEAQRFLTATSEAYDRTFAYRFLYKLRNYAQHCGLPLRYVDHRARRPAGGGDFAHEYRVYFDAQALLDDYDSWGPSDRSSLSLHRASS